MKWKSRILNLKWSALFWLSLPLLGVVFFFVLFASAEESNQFDEEGKVVFESPRPVTVHSSKSLSFRTSTGGSRLSGSFMDWLMKTTDSLMTWEMNPWKREWRGEGDHYRRLSESDDPADIALLAKIRADARELYEQALERYPELAIEYRNVPDEENGFLKWLEFSEKFENEADLIDVIRESFREGNEAQAKLWLAENRELMDEVRAIAHLSQQSVAGISAERQLLLNGSVFLSFQDAFLAEARFAALEGDVSQALESVQAARGLTSHVGEVEKKTMISETLRILGELSIGRVVMNEIIPTLPADEVDLDAWQQAVELRPRSSSEMAEVFRGEWHVSSEALLFPILVNGEDPQQPSDPADVVDAYSQLFLTIIERNEGERIMDAESRSFEDEAELDFSHLSYRGEALLAGVSNASQSWERGTMRSRAYAGVHEAAFAIMRGDPIPVDPIYGLPYDWNPETRELFAPDTPELPREFVGSIVVPQIGPE